MKDMNRVFLMGRLGYAPELQESKTGRPFTRLRMATNRPRPETADASEEEKADWHTVWVWGRQAEKCVQSLHVGQAVFVEGYLTYWKEDGDRLTKTAIHAASVHFVGARLDKDEPARHPNAVAHPA